MPSNLLLPNNPTLKDFHEYIARMIKERGFDDESIQDLFLLFLEECGEMAKAARKELSHIKTHSGSPSHNLSHETADVFMYLLAICNHFNINLEQAFRDKETVNKRREWK